MTTGPDGRADGRPAPTPVPTPTPVPFEYALLRAVPRVDRGECLNVGVVLYCRAADFLGCAVHLDADRLRCLSPTIDLDAVAAALDGVRSVCDGAPDAGPAGREPLRVRFGWVTAPRSTVVQPSPVHPGLTTDPSASLDRLRHRLVG